MSMSRSTIAAGALLALGACGQMERVTQPTVTRGWQPAVSLGPAAGGRVFQDPAPVAIDGQGRAVIVWVEEIADREARAARLQAASFDPVRGWSAAQTIAYGDFQTGNLDLQMDRGGNAVALAAAWADHGHVAAFRAAGREWSPPYPTSFQTTEPPRVALLPDGRAIALLKQGGDGATGVLRAAGLSREKGWEAEWEPIVAGMTVSYKAFDIVADGRGQATAVWVENGYGLPETRIWASHRRETWDRPTLLLARALLGSAHFSLAAGQEGSSVVIWEAAGGLEAARFTENGGWSALASIPAPKAQDPKVCMNGRGGALAVWSSPRGLEAATLEPGGDWSPPATHVVPRDPSSYDPVYTSDVGVDDAGQAMVVWVQQGRVLAASLSSAGAWGTPIPLQATPQWARWSRIAVNGKGEAVATWVESQEKGHQVWSARFVP
jgi:hypothetical protein